MSPAAKVIISVVATAVVVGGGVFYFVNQNASADKEALQTTINQMNANIAAGSASNSNATTGTNTNTAATNTNASTASTCQSSGLQAALTDGSGAAGTYYYTLGLKNTGSAACTYSGSTTVSLLDSSNVALGSATTATSATLTIAAGQSIYAVVGFPNPSNVTNANACRVGATTLAAYPPNQTTAVTVNGLDQLLSGWTDYYCPGFTVQAFASTKP